MPDVTLSIPAETLRLYAKYNGYQAKIDDPANPGTQIDNPESRQQFIKRVLKDAVRAGAHSAYHDEEAAKIAAPTGLDVT